MTDIKIVKNKGEIVKVICSGHTGYGEVGEDIVCSAISSIVQTALLGLMTVAHVNVQYKVDEKEGYLEFAIKDNISKGERHDSSVILDTMLCGLSDLNTEYSDFMNLEVIE